MKLGFATLELSEQNWFIHNRTLVELFSNYCFESRFAETTSKVAKSSNDVLDEVRTAMCVFSKNNCMKMNQ